MKKLFTGIPMNQKNCETFFFVAKIQILYFSLFLMSLQHIIGKWKPPKPKRKTKKINSIKPNDKKIHPQINQKQTNKKRIKEYKVNKNLFHMVFLKKDKHHTQARKTLSKTKTVSIFF